MKFDKLCNSILERVYHGTPHDVVGNFSLNKIGSGEGAQVYGWGLYFAENPDVAEYYKNKLSTKNLDDSPEYWDNTELPKDLNYEENLEYIRLGQKLRKNHNLPKEELQKWRDLHDIREKFKNAIEENRPKAKKNIYEVDINADKENDFLDWDEPVYELDKAYRSVNDLFEKKFGDKKYWQGTISSGGLFYSQIAKTVSEKIGKLEQFGNLPTSDESKNASEFLREAGIKGIKYLDRDSRGTEEGTYNYVIFDPSIIKIVAKNGEFVMASKTPENVEV